MTIDISRDKRRILLVDDDMELCELLKEYLNPAGFVCEAVFDGQIGLDLLREDVQNAGGERPALVILDVMLPGKSGFEVLAALRADARTAALPVIMLTAQGDEVNRVVGLEMGADDYLPKPFNPRELLARIRAVLRRADSLSGASMPELPSAKPDLVLDVGAMQVWVNGAPVTLTGQECRLLRLLLETPGKLVGREKLCREVLGRGLRTFDRSLDMQISRLRKKIGLAQDGSERIRSVRGEGYMYVSSGKIM